MVKYSDPVLDRVFTALADPTRRGVLAALGEGSSLAVSELAAPHGMSLPGFMKHLRVLEEAGLIERTKEGRVVSCTLQAEPMKDAAEWIAYYQRFWTEKLDALGRFLYQQEELQTWNKPAFKPTSPRLPSTGSSPSRRKRYGGRGPTRKR
jgi:DNA-binding transcriptional ArsR family regulator